MVVSRSDRLVATLVAVFVVLVRSDPRREVTGDRQRDHGEEGGEQEAAPQRVELCLLVLLDDGLDLCGLDLRGDERLLFLR